MELHTSIIPSSVSIFLITLALGADLFDVLEESSLHCTWVFLSPPHIKTPVASVAIKLKMSLIQEVSWPGGIYTFTSVTSSVQDTPLPKHTDPLCQRVQIPLGGSLY